MSFTSNFGGGGGANSFQAGGNPLGRGMQSSGFPNQSQQRGTSSRGRFRGTDSNFRALNTRPTNREVSQGSFAAKPNWGDQNIRNSSFAKPNGSFQGNSGFGAPFNPNMSRGGFGQPQSATGQSNRSRSRSNSRGGSMNAQPNRNPSQGANRGWPGPGNQGASNSFGNAQAAFGGQGSSFNVQQQPGQSTGKSKKKLRPTNNKQQNFGQPGFAATNTSFGTGVNPNLNSFGSLAQGGQGGQAAAPNSRIGRSRQNSQRGFASAVGGVNDGQPLNSFKSFGAPGLSSFTQTQPVQPTVQSAVNSFMQTENPTQGPYRAPPQPRVSSRDESSFSEVRRAGRDRGSRGTRVNQTNRERAEHSGDEGASRGPDRRERFQRGDRGVRGERGDRGGRGTRGGQRDGDRGRATERGSRARGGRGARGNSTDEGGALARRIVKNNRGKQPTRRESEDGSRTPTDDEASYSDRSNSYQVEDSRSQSRSNYSYDSRDPSHSQDGSDGNRSFGDGYDDYRDPGAQSPVRDRRAPPVASRGAVRGTGPVRGGANPRNSIKDRILLKKPSIATGSDDDKEEETSPKNSEPKLRIRSTKIGNTSRFMPPPPPLETKDAPSKISDLPAPRRLQEGVTPRHVTEVSNSLMAKVQAFSSRANNQNDTTIVMYKLYLQKRRKRTLETKNKHLISILNKLENIDFVYTDCFGMCPSAEVRDREEGGDVDVFERGPDTSIKALAREKAIKRFSRSAADIKLDIPELLRPPYVLSRTLDYLWDKVIDDDLKESSIFIQPRDKTRADYCDAFHFASDRLRSVKQDMNIIQSHGSELCSSKPFITIYEQVSRFYILSCNELTGNKTFDPKMALDELTKTLTSLVECYQSARTRVKQVYASSRSTALDIDEVDKIQEIVYISPCEPDFLCYNLLIMYFGQPAQFQSSVGKVLKDHPEIESTPQFNTLLEAVSCLRNKNYPRYLKMIREQKDIIFASVMALPQFLAIIRVEYFDIIRRMGAPANQATSGMEEESAPTRTISFRDLKQRLSLDSDEDTEFMLKFFYCKNQRGEILYNIEQDYVNLSYFSTPVADQKRYLDKHKPFRPLAILRSKLKDDDGKKIARSTLIKGPPVKKNINQYVEQVHGVTCATISKLELLEDDDIAEPAVVITPKAVSSLKERLALRESQKEAVPASRDANSQIETFDGISKPAATAVVAPKIQRTEAEQYELAKQFALRKARSRLKNLWHKWVIYSMASNEQQVKQVQEFLETKNYQVKLQCLFNLAKFKNYMQEVKEALLDKDNYYQGSLLDLQDLAEPFQERNFFPEYNCFQNFILEIFENLLENWFQVLNPLKTINHNFDQVKEFDLEWLVIRDSSLKTTDFIQMSSFFSGFLLKSQNEVIKLLQGKAKINKMYFLENWRSYQGTFVLTVSIRCKELSKVTPQDIKNASIVMHLNTDPLNQRVCAGLMATANKEIGHLKDGFLKSDLTSLYFRSFSEVVSILPKQLLTIQPVLSDNKVSISTDKKKGQNMVWHSFNGMLSYETETAYLGAIKRIFKGLIEDFEAYFSLGGLSSAQIILQLHQWKPSVCFEIIASQLRLMEESRTPSGFSDDSQDDTRSSEYLINVDDRLPSCLGSHDGQLPDKLSGYLRACLTRKAKGFFLVKNLVLEVIKQISHQNWFAVSETSPSHEYKINTNSSKASLSNSQILLNHIIQGLEGNHFLQDFARGDSLASQMYQYIEQVVIEPFKKLRRVTGICLSVDDVINLENVVKPLIYNQIVPLVQFNKSDGCCKGSWLTVFESMFVLISRILKILEGKEVELQEQQVLKLSADAAEDQRATIEQECQIIGTLKVTASPALNHGLYDLFKDTVNPMMLIKESQKELDVFKKSFEAQKLLMLARENQHSRLIRPDAMPVGEAQISSHRRERRAFQSSNRRAAQNRLVAAAEEVIPGLVVSPVKPRRSKQKDAKQEMDFQEDLQLVIRQSSEEELESSGRQDPGFRVILQEFMHSDEEGGVVEPLDEEDLNSGVTSRLEDQGTNTPSEAATEDPDRQLEGSSHSMLGKRLPRLLFAQAAHEYSLTALLLNAQV